MREQNQLRAPGSIRILCEAAPDYGVTPGQCLQDTGLMPFDLYNADARVTLAQEVTAIRNFLRHAPDRPGLGIEIGRRYRPEVFGIWGYAILSSPTLRAAFNTALDFANLGFIIATMELHEDQTTPLLTFDTRGLDPGVKGFVLERHLTVLNNFSRVLTPERSLQEFLFRTSMTDPRFATTLRDQLGLQVELGQDLDAIVLPLRLLDHALPQHDPAAMEYCLEQCRSLLQSEAEPQPEWTERVRDAVLLSMNNDPNAETVAANLGVSERTLRRRLSEEGTSFRRILNDARLTIGHELLKTAGLDVSTVAWRTGYSEPSSFVRAFSRKYGYSPGSLKRAG